MTDDSSSRRQRRELDAGALPKINDHRLRLLLNHWLDRRGDEAVPLRSAIDPAALAPALPAIWICEYVPDVGRFRTRLAGEDINRFYGRNIAQTYFEDIAAEPFLSTIIRRYRRIIEEPAIMYLTGHIYLANESRVVGERLGLPLRTEDGRITQVIGASVYDIPPQHFDLQVTDDTMGEQFTLLFR